MPTLTGNTALDVAIGLGFVYLLFSVLCSAVQEAIAGILDLRARTLESGLKNLLQDDGAANTGGAPAAVGSVPASTPGPAAALPPQPGATGADSLTNQVLGHGLIRTLYKDSSSLALGRDRRGPSYIPSRAFALALLNVVAPVNAEDQIAEVRSQISASTIIPSGTKSALMSLANGAATDRDDLREGIERWFDGTMSRVSGWYKRQTQIIICALSLLVAVGLNINTVSIAERSRRLGHGCV
jgi:hypothetical protein